VIVTAAGRQPTTTDPGAITTPLGASVGSLQVFAGSPIRAAPAPSKKTLVLALSTLGRSLATDAVKHPGMISRRTRQVGVRHFWLVGG
jgi:hypothetical protein